MPRAIPWAKIQTQDSRALIFNHILALLPFLPSCEKSGLSYEDAGDAGRTVVLAGRESLISEGTKNVLAPAA